MPEAPRIIINATQARSAIYKGRPLQKMTREELIDVIIEMTNEHMAELNAAYHGLGDHLKTIAGTHAIDHDEADDRQP